MTLEEFFWRNTVVRSTNEQLAKALEAINDYPDPDFILREAARRLRRMADRQ